MADWVVLLVSNLKEYLGLLFSTLVVNLRPPGPLLTVVVVTVDPGELGLFSLAMSSILAGGSN